MGQPFSTRACLIDDCGGKHKARGYCNLHYRRLARNGDPIEGQRRFDNPEEAFEARTERRGDCLIWTGAVGSNGYGQLRTEGRLVPTHRYAWEVANGPIPDGMKIDHRYHCDPLCCEPSHLRAATNQENGRNRSGPDRGNAAGRRGVTRRGGRYSASIFHNGKRVSLGSYSTAEEAARVASEARRKYWGEFAGAG